MQLVAYGAQDIYLTGNPQITFFKVVYRRHTNFSMESIEQTFNGTPDFGRKVVCTISRNGDLIHRVYLQVELPGVEARSNDYFRWVNWVGHALIKNVEVEIGGQRIDKHYGDWLHIWNELTQTSGKQAGYASMVGNVDRLYRPVSNGGAAADATGTSPQEVLGNQGVMPQTTLFIPLQFWFCGMTQVSLYHSSPFSTTKSRLTLSSDRPLTAAVLLLLSQSLPGSSPALLSTSTTSTLIPTKEEDSLRYPTNTSLSSSSSLVMNLLPAATTRLSSTSTTLARNLSG